MDASHNLYFTFFQAVLDHSVREDRWFALMVGLVCGNTEIKILLSPVTKKIST